MPVNPADDQRHEPDSDAPEWSESWVFYFIDPRRQLCCMSRLGLTPNKGSCSVTVCMSREGKPIYHRQLEDLPLPGGDVLSGISAGGFTFRSLSLSRGRYLISFLDPVARLSFDFDWQGLHEPADSIAMHIPGGVADYSNMHIEQMGRIEGRMSYRGQNIDLVGMGPRDHSTGVRQRESMSSFDLAWIMMDDGRAFGLIQAQRGPVVIQVPWMWDKSQLLPLSGMRFEKTLDQENRPATVTILVADPLRRRYLFKGTRRTSMACYHDGCVVHSGYFDFLLDDGTRGIGAQEYGYRLGEAP